MDEKELEKDIPEEALIDDDEDDDIEFDDDVNFEALTQQLQEHIELESIEEPENDVEAMETSEIIDSTELIQEPEETGKSITFPEDLSIQETSLIESKSEVSPLEDFPKDICKKYVVYITPENVDFVDSLSIDDRNRLINKIIYEQHVVDKKIVVIDERKRYIKHLMVVCLTIVLGFPLTFFVVNKSLQASISNYEQSQKNFEKLYKEKGKISSYQKLEAQQQ